MHCSHFQCYLVDCWIIVNIVDGEGTIPRNVAERKWEGERGTAGSGVVRGGAWSFPLGNLLCHFRSKPASHLLCECFQHFDFV